MVLAVELRYAGIGVGFVVPKFLFCVCPGDTSGDKIVPIVELLNPARYGCTVHGISPDYERVPFPCNGSFPKARNELIINARQ